jgi:DNA mismatch endonuclease (patch repair protein)
MRPRTPGPSSDAARRRMTVVGRRDTAAEMALRTLLHRSGLRYRVDHPPIPGLRRRADVVFKAARVAVFVDGCFWHGCPEHATWPKANADFWRQKIQANRRRDLDTDARLAEAGWQVLRFWEHRDPAEAAVEVLRLTTSRSPRIRSSQRPPAGEGRDSRRRGERDLEDAAQAPATAAAPSLPPGASSCSSSRSRIALKRPTLRSASRYSS